jgi:hypothetical protein
MNSRLAVSCLFLAFFGICSVMQAQSAYRVDYFANANTAGAPDATLRLDNDGAAASVNLCADIFVFDSNEEMSECCSCLETPDGLRTLSVSTDLTANPLTGVILTTGLFKIVAVAPYHDTCPIPSTITTVSKAEIQAWATHIQSSSNTITEAPSQLSYLTGNEQMRLAQQCGAIRSVGSGAGICSCGTGTGS